MANQLQLLRLQLSADQLDALRGATDALLNVPAATTTAKEFGRTAALGALHGRAVMEAKLANHAGSVAKARHLPLKRRRRSGRSNWPSSKEGRSLLRTRTAERRAAGLSSTVVTSSAAAALSDRERDAVRALRDQVAQRRCTLKRGRQSSTTPELRCPRRWRRARRWCTRARSALVVGKAIGVGRSRSHGRRC
jgi:hypothetical protein